MVLGIAAGTGKRGRKQNISADVGITRPKEMVVVVRSLLSASRTRQLLVGAPDDGKKG